MTNVAYYLPLALAKKVSVSYFPRFSMKMDYLKNCLNAYREFLSRKFDIIHFNVTPGFTKKKLSTSEICKSWASSHGSKYSWNTPVRT